MSDWPLAVIQATLEVAQGLKQIAAAIEEHTSVDRDRLHAWQEAQQAQRAAIEADMRLKSELKGLVEQVVEASKSVDSARKPHTDVETAL
jgi:hypothetical protein